MHHKDKYAVVMRHYDQSEDRNEYRIIGYTKHSDDAAIIAISTTGDVGDIISVVDINYVSDIENNDIYTCVVRGDGKAFSVGSVPVPRSLMSGRHRTWQNSWEAPDVSVFSMINICDNIDLPVRKIAIAGSYVLSYAMRMDGKSYELIDDFLAKVNDTSVTHKELKGYLYGNDFSEIRIIEAYGKFGSAAIKILNAASSVFVFTAANRLRDAVDIISEGKGDSFLIELAAAFREAIPLRRLLLEYVDQDKNT